MVAAASLEVSPWAAETTRLAGQRDNRLGASGVASAARLAVAIALPDRSVRLAV